MKSFQPVIISAKNAPPEKKVSCPRNLWTMAVEATLEVRSRMEGELRGGADCS